MGTVRKKKEEQKYFSLVRKAAHSHYLEQLTKEEGQDLLTELTSLLDGTEISGLSQAKDQPSQDSDLMDLLSLTNGSWGEENVNSLKKKMEDKFVERNRLIRNSQRPLLEPYNWRKGRKSQFKWIASWMAMNLFGVSYWSLSRRICQKTIRN